MLALQQKLQAQAAGMVKITDEQRAYLIGLTSVGCADPVPIAALQAARAYGEVTTGILMPWPYMSLPDGAEFLVESEEAVSDGTVGEDPPAQKPVDVLAKPSLQKSLADIRGGLQERVIGQDGAVTR